MVIPRVYTQSPKGGEEEVYGRLVRAIMYNDSDLLKKVATNGEIRKRLIRW